MRLLGVRFVAREPIGVPCRGGTRPKHQGVISFLCLGSTIETLVHLVQVRIERGTIEADSCPFVLAPYDLTQNWRLESLWHELNLIWKFVHLTSDNHAAALAHITDDALDIECILLIRCKGLHASLLPHFKAVVKISHDFGPS